MNVSQYSDYFGFDEQERRILDPGVSVDTALAYVRDFGLTVSADLVPAGVAVEITGEVGGREINASVTSDSRVEAYRLALGQAFEQATRQQPASDARVQEETLDLSDSSPAEIIDAAEKAIEQINASLRVLRAVASAAHSLV